MQSFIGEPRMEMQQVFRNERFPNIVVTLKGTVIVTWGNNSIRARRSEDGGNTWGDEIVIAKPGFQCREDVASCWLASTNTSMTIRMISSVKPNVLTPSSNTTFDTLHRRSSNTSGKDSAKLQSRLMNFTN